MIKMLNSFGVPFVVELDGIVWDLKWSADSYPVSTHLSFDEAREAADDTMIRGA